MCEYDEVKNKAAKAGETVDFGRVFPIVVEKGSELPPEQRKYKGCVVFQGNNVKDQVGLVGEPNGCWEIPGRYWVS